MAFVYLTHQGARISRKGDALKVTADGQELADIEIHHVEALCLFGRVHLTIPAIELLLDRGVETAFLTVGGRLKGQLTPVRPKNVSLRLEQFRQFLDPARRLSLGRAFVRAKLFNAAELVQRFAYNHPEAGLTEAADELKSYADRADRAAAIPELLGIEGAGSRVYFGAFARMCRGDLAFSGRSSRPPRDPMNALLSFGYVMLGNEVAALLDAVGFDPYLGFYHEPQDARCSLAIDLIEEFRHPLIDRLCLTMVNRRVLRRTDFVGDEEAGFRLTPEALKRFLAEYDRWMRSSPRGTRPCPRELIRRQIDALARCLRDRAAYVPFRFED